MRLGELEVIVDRTDVVVRRGEAQLATARWNGRRLTDRDGSFTDGEWSALESAIRDDEEQAVAESDATAQDAEGVDVTLIDWMLSLTPTERLRVLMRHASGLAGFVRDDLRE